MYVVTLCTAGGNGSAARFDPGIEEVASDVAAEIDEAGLWRVDTERSRDLGADFVAFAADGGPEVNEKGASHAAEVDHTSERRIDDTGGGPAPSGVGESEGAAIGIDEEDGDAVGNGDGQQ